MSRIQMIKDILAAIDSVKSRARRAIAEGRTADSQRLMGDLLALESCLVTETSEFVKEEEFVRKAA